MSKALWFLVAILLCSALAIEALICNKCRRYNFQFGCLDKKPSFCIAKPGQKCKVVIFFLGSIRGIIKQGCTKSIYGCNLHTFDETVSSVKTTCCDDHDHCNIP